MNKTLGLVIMAFWCSLSVLAQQYKLSGKVVESPSQHPIELATVSLLSADSSRIAAGMSSSDGTFQIKTARTGSFILKVSFIGFLPQYRPVHIHSRQSSYSFGNISLEPSSNMLGTATVQAAAAKMQQVEDTTLFNAAAYRVPEGSTLEALVKQLPGVEIEDNGTITWNGKTVKEFLVNGKDFFKGQTDVALQNLPVEWVSRIKAYEKRSEYAEQTGIDDGEEAPVLDIVTKRELNQTLLAKTDLAYGTDDRYAEKLFLSRFTERSRVSVYGSANNVSDKSFGGKRKRSGGGVVTRQNAGSDFYWENDKKKKEAGKMEIGGNIHYNHSKTNLSVEEESEHFLAGGSTSSYRSIWNRTRTSNLSFDASLRLEWHPDTLTSLIFRPAYKHNESKNGGQSFSATFNDNPFDIPGMVSPLDSIEAGTLSASLSDILVNRNNRLTKGDRKNDHFNGSLNLVRRLNGKGRNVSLALSGGYSRNVNHSFTISNIFYYNGDAPKYLNQYSAVPSANWNYKLQVGYVEPIASKWYADVHYAYSQKYTDSDRSRFNLDRIDSIYGSWYDPNNYPEIGLLPDEGEILAAVRDSVNSQYATYKYFEHIAHLSIKYNSKTIRFNAGVQINPERTEMAYERPGQQIDTLITRHVFNVSPQMNFRYRMDKRNSIEARYRGYASQPSMTDLLAVVDNSHPLNVSMGNPGLKPSWTHNLDLGYRGYLVESQQGFSVGYNFSQTKNAVNNLSVYDESTGVRYHRPENINGNWNTRLNLVYNAGLGKEKNFTIGTNTNFVFNNAVGYISSVGNSGSLLPGVDGLPMDYDYYESIFNGAEIQKNITRTFSMREKLNLGYRKDWLEVGTFASFRYNHSRSNRRKKNDRDTWDYSYGLNTNLMFDCGLSFSTDIRMNSRRGYPNVQMNTDEILWNAQLAYSFLKRKQATVSIQLYDILKEQSNVSHMISATRRSDSWNNAINSYGMIHFIYKFRHIGGKDKKGGKSWKKHQKKGRKGEASILDDVMGDDDL